MRGFLLKGFFRCKALTPGGHNHGLSRKRRKLLPLPALKRRKVTKSDVEASLVEPDVALNVDANPLVLHDEEEEEEEDMQSEESSGNETEEGEILRPKEVLGVQSAPLERDVEASFVEPDVALNVDANPLVLHEEEEEEEEVDMQSEESSGNETEEGEILRPKEVLGVQSAPLEREQPNLYPLVVYEGKACTVSLGVGQVVILDGCAMVQVIDGQASMLGYFLPCGVDVLVSSSSKLAEAVSIEARRTHYAVGDVNMAGGSDKITGEDVLGCVLRFTSHVLGKQTLTSDSASDGKLSFKLDFIGALGRCLQRKRSRDDFEDKNPLENQEWSSDEEENDLDAEVSSSSSSSDEDGRDDVEKVGTPLNSGVFRKRKRTEASTSNAKRQQLPMSGNNSSAATILPQTWRDAVDLIMLEKIILKQQCLSGTQITTVGKNWHSSCSYAPVVAICGARNVGKSTFARFMVNSLLNRHKQVAYLDTDIGQPEFTVPGCISLHVLNRPVVGPPAMHLRTPERCFFYGDISPKSDPILYGQNVAELYTHFQHQYCNDGRNKMPLVINTHGWVKGIGFDVVADILRCTSPTHVVQLLTNSVKKDLPCGKFWDESSEAKTLYIESAVKNLDTPRSGRTAHHLRAARVLAYFQQCSGDNPAPFPYKEEKLFAQTAISLVNEAPYQVPITALTIKHLHSEVPPSESLRAINASLVGLAISFSDKQTTGESLPLCIGIGIVKAVDVQKGIFYICTPVPVDQLQKVTTLLQGRIETPVPLLMAKGHSCPYFCRESLIVEGVGAAAMKSTRKVGAKK